MKFNEKCKCNESVRGGSNTWKVEILSKVGIRFEEVALEFSSICSTGCANQGPTSARINHVVLHNCTLKGVDFSSAFFIVVGFLPRRSLVRLFLPILLWKRVYLLNYAFSCLLKNVDIFCECMVIPYRID